MEPGVGSWVARHDTPYHEAHHARRVSPCTARRGGGRSRSRPCTGTLQKKEKVLAYAHGKKAERNPHTAPNNRPHPPTRAYLLRALHASQYRCPPPPSLALRPPWPLTPAPTAPPSSLTTVQSNTPSYSTPTRFASPLNRFLSPS